MPGSGQTITHQKSQKWNSIGKCHWNPLEDSSGNPQEKWQSFATFNWQMKLCWNRPLNIHWKMPLKSTMISEVLISGVQYFAPLREYLSTGYGLRFSTEICGGKWERTVFHEYLQEARFLLTDISENFRKPPEFSGESNLEILYSSSLLPAQVTTALAVSTPGWWANIVGIMVPLTFLIVLYLQSERTMIMAMIDLSHDRVCVCVCVCVYVCVYIYIYIYIYYTHTYAYTYADAYTYAYTYTQRSCCGPCGTQSSGGSYNQCI